jgi:polar amino acid transport system permease protein
MNFSAYLPDFISGLWLTASVSFLSFAGAMVIGSVTAIARRSKWWLPRAIGAIYVEAIRNTPALVQIFLIYFGLPTIGINLPAYLAGVVALSINVGAYLAEILRAGLEAVPNGQLEAARTLGMKRTDIFFSVVFPQAIRAVYPPVINEFIQLILTTSLLSVIALNEITGVALIVNTLTFETIKAFGVALVVYLVLTNAVSYASKVLAHVLFRPPLVLDQRPKGRAATGRLKMMGVLR